MEAVLESYLYSYRPYGQYEKITEGAPTDQNRG
jgi:hypothetical protein